MSLWNLLGLTDEQINCEHTFEPTLETHWFLVSPDLEEEYPLMVCKKCKLKVADQLFMLGERKTRRKVEILSAEEALKLAKSKKSDLN